MAAVELSVIEWLAEHTTYTTGILIYQSSHIKVDLVEHMSGLAQVGGTILTVEILLH